MALHSLTWDMSEVSQKLSREAGLRDCKIWRFPVCLKSPIDCESVGLFYNSFDLTDRLAVRPAEICYWDAPRFRPRTTAECKRLLLVTCIVGASERC